jgi:hypothetical protein
MDKQKVASELLRLARQLVSMEFDTQDALDKYMKEHPEGDRSNHSVKKQESVQPQGKVKIAPRSVPMTHPEHWVGHSTKEIGMGLREGFGRVESNEDQLIRHGKDAIESMKKAGHDISESGLSNLSTAYRERANKFKTKLEALVSTASQKAGKKIESLRDLSGEDRKAYQSLSFAYNSDIASADGIAWINSNRKNFSL